MYLKISLIALLPLFFSGTEIKQKEQEIISHSFELRYFSDDPTANGETDFKGETEIFTTDQRVEFLKHYAGYATRFFNDPNLDKLVVSKEEIKDAVQKIKPQPLPEFRSRIPLTDWKYLGSRPGRREEDTRNLKIWSSRKGVEIHDGSLRFAAKRVKIEHPIESQDWRMSLQWRVYIPSATTFPVKFMLGDATEAGINESGEYYYITAGSVKTAGMAALAEWMSFKIESDLENGRYNFLVNDQLIADFVELKKPCSEVSVFIIEAGRGLQIDDIWGVSYRMTYEPDGHNNTRDVPFSINTFIDENFQRLPDVSGWNLGDYDDSSWEKVPSWPYAHGGERHRDESLYLRKVVRIGKFDYAELKAEQIFPSGEIWVNGRVVEVRHDPRPFTINLTEYLIPDADNLIAVRVNPNKVKYTMRHTPSDEYSGWYAGRMWLELKDKRRIMDVFVYTEKTEPGIATLGLEIDVRNDLVLHPEERERKKSNSFEGSLNIALFKWFPEESKEPVITRDFPLSVYLGEDKKWKGTINIAAPELWTPEKPVLYKLVVQLTDSTGKVIDDEVVTTGIRTVSQEGGTFHINGVPQMMNGALIFGFRYPLEHVSQWLWRAPAEKLVEDILMLKRMNANTARMSIHDGPAGGTNDPRFAEIGDQLGILFQWQTVSWVRTDSPYLIDFTGLPAYVRQVRNHPSIVMWQPGNHPYLNNFKDAARWMEKIYQAITPNDMSRLISPTASSSAHRIQTPNDDGTLDYKGNPVEPEPVWIAPLITRGNMDFATGYGFEWSTLRHFPYPKQWTGDQNWLETGYRAHFLESKERAYFDFESEESIGQPNWNLHKGKPQYRIQSYEYIYDNGSIGRLLTPDEWKISQAWQAMSGYEAYRKKRWLDYDGLAWCTLRGGGNTATYQKPLIDYYGHAKLAFYATRMVFQPVLSGSKNVDMVYGPDDMIPVVVMNIGERRQVTIEAVVNDMNMNEVFKKTWNVILPEGRTYTDLPAFRPNIPKPGIYAIEYIVKE